MRKMDIPSNFKLELVQVLFRHGARVYSKRESDVLKPEDVDHSLIEEFGYDQLTKLGKKQAYTLGCALRERYDEFLGSDYRPQEVYAYSSDTDRTKMSLQLVLTGLYPPTDQQKWHPDLNWMPVPIHCAPIECDILLRASDKPRYKQVFEEVCSNTPEIRAKFSEMANDAKSLHKNGVASSGGVGGIRGIIEVHNIFTIQMAEKRKLVDWYSDELMDKLRYSVETFLDFMLHTAQLKKLFAGALIKRFIENLNVNDEVHNPRKIYLYSGHELNIAAFLKSLENKDFRYPYFSSAVVMEKLRDSEGHLYVRFMGWNGRDDHFITLKMGNCDEICNINDFLKHAKDIIPSAEEIQEMYNDMNIDLRRAFATDFVYQNSC